MDLSFARERLALKGTVRGVTSGSYPRENMILLSVAWPDLPVLVGKVIADI